jgi:hypothetical protein
MEDRPVSAEPPRPASQTSSRSGFMTDRPGSVGSTFVDQSAQETSERQKEEIARLKLECLSWESVAAESKAAEESAKYQTQLKELEIQVL